MASLVHWLGVFLAFTVGILAITSSATLPPSLDQFTWRNMSNRQKEESCSKIVSPLHQGSWRTRETPPENKRQSKDLFIPIIIFVVINCGV